MASLMRIGRQIRPFLFGYSGCIGIEVRDFLNMVKFFGTLLWFTKITHQGNPQNMTGKQVVEWKVETLDP